MLLRVLPVLLMLGLPAVADAADALAHVCKGRLQLRVDCCCHEREPPAAPVGPSARADAGREGCCDLLEAAAPMSAPATTAPSSAQAAWAVALPPAPATQVPLAEEQLPPTWRRSRGVHHAAAPPLYQRHCSYLL
ncbi:hypothetical protein HPC49_32975 [Pyxidicoccus fallax]|uniref:Uncharacterized protein n=1 Tax=Pyxidicoccus fallax TaxID=394095 RepID=A0A848LVM4_9BACT|nr:hypothetical protein [Pyxidicoccus fallax]NMO21483.1 hypothetical protein [Pyxidicoccus fallax]NPC83023.1 hypothetical protein [Pyxidicoccus fallax]